MGKITGYAALSAVLPDDVLAIVDVHDTTMASSGTTKKVTVASLVPTDWLNVKGALYGAAGDGVTDDTTAIQAAITAAEVTGSTVYFPAGQYLISSSLTITGTVRLTGAGIGSGSGSSHGTLIKTASGASSFHMFTFSGSVSGLEIDHMTINQNTTAGGDMFHEIACVDSHFHDLQLNVNNTAGSAVQMSGTQSLLNVLFERCNFQETTATRSNPLINLSNGASGAFSNVTFFKCKFTNSGFDNTQWLVYLACTAGAAGYHYYEVFRDCWFEHPFGGCVKSLSGQDVIFDGCAIWDIFSGQGQTVGNSMYYIGAAPSGPGSQQTRWSSCGRNRNGPDGSSTWDIYCESTTYGTIVEGYGIKPDTASTQTNVFFNFNGHPDITLIGNVSPQGSSVNGNSTTVVTNPGTNLNQIGPGPGPTSPGPSANQLLAWSWDINANGSNAGNIAIGGTLYLIEFILYVPTLLSKLWWWQTAAAVTPTSGQSQAGVYNQAAIGASAAGTLVASATAAATATAMTGTNAISVALSATYMAPPGAYWQGMVFQAATEPTLLHNGTNNGGMANVGITSAALYRICVNGTGITTALPSSITPSSNSQAGINCYWVGQS